MILPDYTPRHRANVSALQLAEHEYQVGHLKFKAGKHEALCYCTRWHAGHVFHTNKCTTQFVPRDRGDK